MQMLPRWLLAAAAILILYGCSRPTEPHDWFPLQPGLEWQYQVTEQSGDQKTVRRFSIETIDVRLLGEFSAIENLDLSDLVAATEARDASELEVFTRRSSDGTDYYYVAGEEGLLQLGKRTLIEKQPRWYSTARLVMPWLEEMVHGISWNLPTLPYLIHSTQGHVAWNRSSNGFELVYELVEEGITVETVAGTFDDCILLEGRALIGLYADPKLGYQEVEVVQREWYAKGVGLLRLEREEPLDMMMFKGGSLAFELIRFTSR